MGPSFHQRKVIVSNKARYGVLTMMALLISGCFATGATPPEITVKEFPEEKKVSISGWDYLSSNNYAGAITAFQSALAETPDNTDLRYGLAEAYRHAGKHEWAEKQYAELLAQDTHAARAMTGIGLVKLMSFDGNGAFEMLNAAIEEDKTEWKAWLGLAQLRDSGKDSCIKLPAKLP